MAAPLLLRQVLLLRVGLHIHKRFAFGVVPVPKRLWCSDAATNSPSEEAEERVGNVVRAKEQPPSYGRWDEPDFRKWKDKEKEILSDIEPIILLTKDILHPRRYMDGEQLRVEDEKAVVENLLAYHPHSEDKNGCGLESIVVIWRKNEKGFFAGMKDCPSLSRKRMSHQSDVKVDAYTLPALMLYYAENGLFSQAYTTWEQLVNSSFVPSIQFISKLFDVYGKQRNIDQVIKILHYVNSRDFGISPVVYSLAISCFGRGGQLALMEDTIKEMVSRGFRVGSKTANAYLLYYSIFGSLKEMENAYGRLKRSRFLVEEEAIRAVASAYVKNRKMYELGEFLRDVGLGRKNVGNLLWNRMLLSYATNFKMKSLQREFLTMLEAGFRPDVTTFNIRALAFSRMSLFWDLHLSIEHMKHEKVIPDLVTYGCVVDAYLDRKLGKNLDFALNKMNMDDSPQLLTDPFVFEALGKGDFHLSSEAFLEFKTQRQWTYRTLIQKYLKKHFRRNQIFWNY